MPTNDLFLTLVFFQIFFGMMVSDRNAKSVIHGIADLTFRLFAILALISWRVFVPVLQ